MKLEKAIFKSLEKKDGKTSEHDVMQVNFNPTELSLDRSMTYAPAQNTQQSATEQSYKGSSNFTLSMTLYFDTFEEGVNVRSKYMTKLESLVRPKKVDPKDSGGPAGTAGTPGTPSPSATDGTGGAAKAPADSGSSSTAPKIEPPPNVLFVWGKFRFVGAIQTLTQKYTMFLADGTPVRAEASISMIQTIANEVVLDLGEGDHRPTEPNKIANDVKEKGAAAALAGMGAGSDFDDPQEIINNASKLDAAKLAAAGESKGSVAGFMDKHGTSMLEGIAAAAVGGYLSGGSSGARTGAFDGALRGAGDTGLFSDSTGGSTLGKAADTLASGQQVNVATLGLGVGNDRFGNIGGGLAIGVQRDGTNLNFGATGGAGISTPHGTTIVGTETSRTAGTDGSRSSTTASGIGVGSAGRPGAPNTLPTVPVGGGGRGSGSVSGRGSGDPGSGTTSGSGSGSSPGGDPGGGAGSGRGGPSPPPSPPGGGGTTGSGSGSGSGGDPGTGAGNNRGG